MDGHKTAAMQTELFRVFEGAPLAMVLVDGDRRVRQANCAARAGYASKPADAPLIGNILGCLHALAGDNHCGQTPQCGECRIRRTVIDTFETGAHHERIEVAISAAAPTPPRTVRLSSVPLIIDGTRMALVCYEDISEQRRAEAARRESEARYRALVESASEHIFMLSREGRYVGSNGRARQFGLSATADLVGKHLTDVYPASVAQPYLDQLACVLDTGRPLTFEHEVTIDGGSVFHLNTLFPIFTDSDLTAVGGICRDVTSLKQAEGVLARHRDELEREVATRTAELEERNLQLQHEITERERAQAAHAAAEVELDQQRMLSMRSDRLRSLGEMAAGIAHELNQPLSGVRGLAEHLLIALDRGWELPAEKMREKLALIVGQADRMTHIVEHVRLFARDADRGERQPVDLSEVVRSAVGMLGQQLRAHDIALRLDLPESPPPVAANPFSLEEVLLNLLTNARDAVEERLAARGGPRGQIAVRGFVDRDSAATPCLRLEVSDNGDGMSAPTAGRAFDPFFTTKGPDRGTGLGLAICKSIVEGFDGCIRIDAGEDAGTTVMVSLPMMQEER